MHLFAIPATDCTGWFSKDVTILNSNGRNYEGVGARKFLSAPLSMSRICSPKVSKVWLPDWSI